jgi:ABC-type branched-subunit amino acid transport system ATPase component
VTEDNETSATSQPVLLRIEGLVKRFGGSVALDRLTLELTAGETLGVTGPNGGGKTTLVNVISGFVRPDQGRVWLSGREITRWPPHRIVRAGVARTFQRPRLAFRFTVAQNLEAAMLHRRLRTRGRRQVVHHILDLVGLAHLRGREVRTLSVGEIRRVEVGRALATDARLLLLDEPFASLSPEDAPGVLSILRRLRGEGRAMLLVAHSPALFRVLCDRVVVIEAGRIVPFQRAGGPPS